MSEMTTEDRQFLAVAREQARIGLAEQGVPIGAALVADRQLVAAGRNRRVQDGSAIRHGETDALERAGRLCATVYRQATMYTTLSPCAMCSGAILLYGIPRVVVGENHSFLGEELLLRERGVEVVVADDAECRALMAQFMAEHPEVWWEDIGVPV
jgi:creatinine deaminase